MSNRDHSERKSEIDFLKAAQKINNNMIFIAITIIVVVALIAMTGVYYEYW
ncbi:hypothetical protein ML462_07775 [Gramella lutea]|uniref:Uncharacterized protein n=1 Tax=Christiangramia lutea TaxID=1607951 RepID=A0A9X1V288_9FLAO|nr:hypothetical protein [Christiangramia lutea]MCH4823072.1 hypothetical protein [Christiangramia lutea]